MGQSLAQRMKVVVGNFRETMKKVRIRNQLGILLLAVMALIGVLILSYFYFRPFEKQHEEISFEEFRNKVLEPRLVDHIVVSNKELAKIYVRRNDSEVVGTTPAKYEYFFNIGSVDSFERKLEKAQEGLDIQHHDFVCVTYSFETKWFPMFILLSELLLIIRVVLYKEGIDGTRLSNIGKVHNNVTKVEKYAKNKVG